MAQLEMLCKCLLFPASSYDKITEWFPFGKDIFMVITYFQAWQETHLDRTEVLRRVYFLLVCERATREVTYPSTLSRSERGGMWYHRIPGRYGSWYQSFVQLDKFSIFLRYSDGPVFKAAVLKVKRTENRRVLCLGTHLIHFWRTASFFGK